MKTLSLVLSDQLAEDSQKIASTLGLSRSEFIRRAIIHELNYVDQTMKLKKMQEAFKAMAHDKDYQKLTAEFDEAFSDKLPDDPEKWWEG